MSNRIDNSPLPTDHFSRTLREKQDNPGAVRSSSTIHSSDFFGNQETWVIETYRTEAGHVTGFLQRNSAEGGMRLVLPPEVMKALARQQDQLVTKIRQRAGRKAVETKRMMGIPIGSHEGLAKARQARRKKA
jgi:hypothetical protein